MADGTVVIKIDGEDKDFLAKIQGLDGAAQKALGGTQSALARVGDGALKVGAALSAGVTAPVTAACAAATTLAMGYEDAFAGVRKTVDMTEEGYDELYRATVALSEVQPVGATTLFRIEELGGQLGIAHENLLSFAQVVSGMDIATDLGAEDAATEMAQFANITGMAQTSMGNLGSTVVALGNTSATTESAIMAMAMRIAGAGSNVGMTQAEILGLAAALSSVGIEAEAGGSAISTVMSNIDKAVATNSGSLGVWASTAGMSAAEFAAAWKNDPVAALQAVVAGMASTVDEGGNLSLLLQDLGITELRQTDMLKRLSGASELMAGSVRTANEAWSENSALQREVDARNDTTSAKLETLKNRVSNAAAELGGPLAEALVAALDAADPLIDALAGAAKAFAEMDDGQQQAVLGAVGLAAAVGPVTSGVGAAAKAVDGVSKALKAAHGATSLLSGGLVALGVTLAGLAVGAVVDAVSELSRKQEEAARRAEDLGTCVGGVAEAIGGLDGQGVPNLCAALDGATESASGVSGAAGAAKDAVGELDGQGVGTLAGSLDGAAESAAGVAEGAGGARDAVGELDGQGVGGLTGSLGEASAGADELKGRVAGALEESRRNVSDTSRRIEAMAGELAKVGRDNSNIRGCAETIKELGAQSDLSAADELRLKDAVDQFNEATGSSFTATGILSGAYDDLSGSIDRITEAYVAQAKVQAISNGLTQLFADQVEQQRMVDESAQTLADAYLALWESMYPGEVIDQVASGFGKTREELAQTATISEVTADSINDNLLSAYAGMVESGALAETQTLGVADAQGTAADSVRDASEALDNNRAALAATNGDIGYLSEALEEATAAQGEAEQAAAGVAEAVEAQGEASSAASGGVSELAEAARSAEAPLAGLRGTVSELPEALHEFGSTAEEASWLAERAMVGLSSGTADLTRATAEVNEALAAMGLESVQLSEQQVQLAYMTGMTGEEIVAMAQDMQGAADEAEAMALAQEEAAEAAEREAEAVEAERERLQEVVDSMAEFADSHLGMREAIEAGGTSLADFALGLEAAGIGVDGFKSSFETLSSMTNPMERFASETEMYTTTMRDNLVANAEAVRSYSSNVTELYSRATAEQELAFADYVASLGPAQAQFLEYLLYDADVSFQELAVLYAEGEGAAAQGAVDMAEAKGEAAGRVFGEGLAEGAQGIEETAADAVSGVPDAMAEGADMGGAAEQMTGEAAAGIADGTGTVADAVREMGSQAADALIELNDEMRARGEAAGGFAALGVSDSSPLMEGAAGDLCSALQAGVSGMAAAMGAVGGAAAGALSEGVSSRAAATGEAAASHQEQAASALSRFEPSMRAAGDAAGSALASGALGRATDTASAARAHMSAAASALSGFAPSMGAAGSAGGQAFAAELQRQMGASYSAGSSVAGAALSGLSSFNASAYWSGREMGQNFAGGVSSAIGSIAAAASDAAGAAAAYLHFSEPERGPLVGINASGGEMVHNFAASMLRAVPEIERSSERAAAAARFGDEVSAYLEAWAPPRGLSPSWEAASASLSARGAAPAGSVTYSCGDVTVSAADSMEAASFAEWMQDVLREAGMY